MARLQDLTPGSRLAGLRGDGPVEVVDVKWFGDSAVELTFKDDSGKPGNELLYRSDEARLEVLARAAVAAFDGDGDLFRLVSEAYRIRLGYLFDPLLAVHTSLVDPLPHQIQAVYGEMLPRQPLRFLLADDPGAGKTIMAGLLIKELCARGDLRRCLIICPGALVEQWQDELNEKFQLPFEILTGDKLEAARTGNWLAENDLAVARLDKLSRDDDVQAKLAQTDWDLVVVDEAHKMSASFFGSEVRETRRYRLGKLLGGLTRHLLLMSATPHNGKEADFQLFLALLDADRFEGRFRDGVHLIDPSDLMRRLVKEQLLKFDGRPLFPERRAYSPSYKLSEAEARLYHEVTEYVRQEFNRADQLETGRRGTVGFALTILQRRLASSPEAIYQSLRRRRARLERRLQEEELLKRGGQARIEPDPLLVTDEDLEQLEDAPEEEIEAAEQMVVDQATAAQTVAELQAEIASLTRLEGLARTVRHSGRDKKWEELSSILQNRSEMWDEHGHRRKLVIFTEHRDTLDYLSERIGSLIGRAEAVVCIHGGLGREQRRSAQERFTQDKTVEILLATDAAGEGINLQRAHLMVNYDLPWNPNRLEHRFGRIHRIGQTEVCHLWNLVAEETREGDVFIRLLEKLEQERVTLGGGVFDILGTLFRDQPLRNLLIEAVRYGDRPEVKARLHEAVDNIADRERCRALLEEKALAGDSMDASKVRAIREDLERAEARRLQPHHVGSFFLEAFKRLGGVVRRREVDRFEITHVPAVVRNRDRQIGRGSPVLSRYERITFRKELILVPGEPLAAFVCPGYPLLDATIDLVLERYRDLLRRGSLLVDPHADGDEPRVIFCLQHDISDGHTTAFGQARVASREMRFVQIGRDQQVHDAGWAPHLDCRPPSPEEAELAAALRAEEWLAGPLEEQVKSYAIQHVVPRHLGAVRARREAQVDKTTEAVRARLQKEINHWDHRAEQLRAQELAGGRPRLNSAKARQRADDLQARLRQREEELQKERRLAAHPPVVLGGALVVPAGWLARRSAPPGRDEAPHRHETARIEGLAMNAVMQTEQALGFEPRDVSAENVGYDVESRVPGTGKLRFIEVKGRHVDGRTVTVTRNEILTGLNKPDDFVLAIVQVDGDNVTAPRYVRRPFTKEPDFGVTSVNYELKELLARSREPC